MLYQQTGTIDLGVINTAVVERSHSIAQPTPIRPYPSSDGFVLYQLYLSHLGSSINGNHSHISCPSIYGSTYWVNVPKRQISTSPNDPSSTTSSLIGSGSMSFTSKKHSWLSHYVKDAYGMDSSQERQPSDKTDYVQKSEHSSSEATTPDTCAICSDRSSGLHYGIYTCEGVVSNFTANISCQSDSRNQDVCAGINSILEINGYSLLIFATGCRELGRDLCDWRESTRCSARQGCYVRCPHLAYTDRAPLILHFPGF
ncbi:zinc finger, C4 type [Dictyocaulus viviparus]|uniref:Zinc finger, C4 type n=1 Tax=Dictyocaulus viviparus TaxID=29172 RepID=A0A0D8XBS9_DICVI|nr:zinc finger, C4 type [Dictyocaulus viviparus]